MKNWLASSVDMGPCQPARVWKRIFVYYLKAVALSGLHGQGRGKRFLVAVALSKIDAGVALLLREVGVAILLCFCSRRRCVYLLSFLRGRFHVVAIRRVTSKFNVRSVSTMTMKCRAYIYLETKVF